MTFALTLKSNGAPAQLPLSRTNAKLHCSIPAADTTHDTLIDNLIASATAYLDGKDGVLGRAIINQTWLYSIDDWPAPGSPIRVPLPPLGAVNSISYVDPDGAAQTLSSSVYELDKASEPGLIWLAYNQSWPPIRSKPNAITIDFTAGYGATDASVPANVRQLVAEIVAHYFQNREAANFGGALSPIPHGAEAKIRALKVVHF